MNGKVYILRITIKDNKSERLRQSKNNGGDVTRRVILHLYLESYIEPDIEPMKRMCNTDFKQGCIT